MKEVICVSVVRCTAVSQPQHTSADEYQRTPTYQQGPAAVSRLLLVPPAPSGRRPRVRGHCGGGRPSLAISPARTFCTRGSAEVVWPGGGRQFSGVYGGETNTSRSTTKSWVPGSHSTGMLRRGAGGRVWAFMWAAAHQAAATAVEAARVRAVEARRGEATHVFLTASKIIWPREVTPWPRYLRSSSPCGARVGVR